MFLLVDDVVEVVLHQDRNHGKRSHPEVVGFDSHPHTQEALVLDTLHCAVDDSLVGEHSLSVYIKYNLLGFIFRILTFMLSKGREPMDADTPEIADPMSLIAVVSFVSPIHFCSFSFASL